MTAPLASIAQVELAMLAQLKTVAERSNLGFAWNTLSTYPADWDAYLSSDARIATPAAWVVFAGWESSYLTTDDEDRDVLVVEGASFGVMVADENKRPDEQYQRHGGPDPAKEPGSYRLIELAIASLANQSLGMLVKPLQPGQLRAVRPFDALRDRKLSMWSAQMSCDLQLTVLADGMIDPEELQVVHANWDVPPFGSPRPVDRDPIQPGVQLPDDAHADATDTVALGDQEEE